MMRTFSFVDLRILAGSLLCTTLVAAKPIFAQKQHAGANWVGSWATSQQVPEPNNAVPAGGLDHAVLRQIVHLSVGGSALRVHVSNAFGARPLHLAAVHVARAVAPASGDIEPGSDRALLFDGMTDVTIPAGAEYLSDPLPMTVAPFTDLAVTIQTEDAPDTQTGHPGSRATSYLAHGTGVDAAKLDGAQKIEHWYMLSGVDVAGEKTARAIVALGDSITDGHGATTNGNDRWTDDLARRLQAAPATRGLGVLNQGIGGNHLLTDGLGPNALARFDRDVLAQTGARYVLVLEGINDLGGSTIRGEIAPAEHDRLVTRLLGAYRQMIERAHARGLPIYGGTITPDVGSGYYHPGPASEADRVKINAWIRAAGHFDGVIDFDRAVADPAQPDRLLPAYDSGDHLHPSAAGYAAMARAVPTALFLR